MHKLIPLIYFYLLSLIGMILLIFGVFFTTHFLIGNFAYDQYPLKYGNESRCMTPSYPVPAKGENNEYSSDEMRKDCLATLKDERQQTKIEDLEKSISFTLVGLIVFGVHFYFARKQKAEKTK